MYSTGTGWRWSYLIEHNVVVVQVGVRVGEEQLLMLMLQIQTPRVQLSSVLKWFYSYVMWDAWSTRRLHTAQHHTLVQLLLLHTVTAYLLNSHTSTLLFRLSVVYRRSVAWAWAHIEPDTVAPPPSLLLLFFLNFLFNLYNMDSVGRLN